MTGTTEDEVIETLIQPGWQGFTASTRTASTRTGNQPDRFARNASIRFRNSPDLEHKVTRVEGNRAANHI